MPFLLLLYLYLIITFFFEQLSVSFGFNTVDEYYSKSSSSKFIKDVKIPLLCIQVPSLFFQMLSCLIVLLELKIAVKSLLSYHL